MEIDSRQKKIELAKKKLNRFRISNLNNPHHPNSNGEPNRIRSEDDYRPFHSVDEDGCHSQCSPSLLGGEFMLGQSSSGNSSVPSTNSLSKLKQALGHLQQSIDTVLHSNTPMESDQISSQVSTVHHVFDTLEKYVAHSREYLNQKELEHSGSFDSHESGPCDSHFLAPTGFEQIDNVQSLLASKDTTIRELSAQIRHLQEANHFLYVDNSKQEQLLCQEVDLLAEKLSSAKTALQNMSQTNATLTSRERLQQMTFVQEREMLHQHLNQLKKEKEESEKLLHEKLVVLERCHMKEVERSHTIMKKLEEDLQRVRLERGKELEEVVTKLNQKDAAIQKLNETLMEREVHIRYLQSNYEIQVQTMRDLEVKNQQSELEIDLLKLQLSQVTRDCGKDEECQCNMLLDENQDFDMFQSQIEDLKTLSESLQLERDNTNNQLTAILMKLKNPYHTKEDEIMENDVQIYQTTENSADVPRSQQNQMAENSVLPCQERVDSFIDSSVDEDMVECLSALSSNRCQSNTLSPLKISSHLTDLVNSNLQEIHELQLERIHLMKELQKSKEDISKLEQMINQLNNRQGTFQQEIYLLREKIEEYERRIVSLNILLDTLQAQLSEACQSREMANSLRLNVEEEKNRVLKEKRILNDEVVRLIASLQNERELKGALEQERSSCLRELERDKELIQNQSSALQQLTMENETMKTELTDLHGEILHSRQTVESYAGKQYNLQKEIDALMKERESLVNGVQKILKKTDAMEGDDVEMNIHDLINSLQNIVSHILQEKTQLFTSLEDKVHEIDKLSHEIGSLKGQVHEMEDKLQLTSEETISLRQTLDEVRRQKEECDSAYNLLKFKYETTHSKYHCALVTALEHQEVSTATQAEVLRLKRSLVEASQESSHFDSRFHCLLEELAYSNVTLSKLVSEREELQRQQTRKMEDVKREHRKEVMELQMDLEHIRAHHQGCLTKEDCQRLSKFGFLVQEESIMASVMDYMENRQVDLERLQNLISCLKNQLDETKMQKTGLMEKVEQLNAIHSRDVATLQVKDAEIVNLREKLLSKEKACDEATAMYAQAQKKNLQLLKEVDESGEQNRLLEQQVAHLSQENKSYKEEIINFTSTVDHLSNATGSLQEALNSANMAVADYKEILREKMSQLSCLEEAIVNVFHSVITSPSSETPQMSNSNGSREEGSTCNYLQAIKEHMLELIVQETQLSEKVKLLETQVEEAAKQDKFKDDLIENLSNDLMLANCYLKTSEEKEAVLGEEVKTLQQQVEEKSSRIAGLMEEIECISGELLHFNDQNRLLESRNVDLESLLEKCRSELSIVNDKLVTEKVSVDEKTHEISLLSEELERSKENSENFREQICTLTQKMEHLRDVIHSKETDLLVRQAEITKLSQNLEDIQERYSLLESDSKQQLQEKSDALSKIKVLEEHLAQTKEIQNQFIQEQLHQKDLMLEGCNADICFLRDEVHSLQEAVRSTSDTCVTHSEINQRLNADLLSAKRHADAMELRLMCMTISESQVRQELERLNILSEESRRESSQKEEELKKQVIDLRNNLSTMSSLEIRERQLGEQIQHANEELARCQGEVQLLQKEKMNLLDEISALKEEITRLTCREIQLSETIQAKDETIFNKQNEYSTLKEQFDRNLEHLNTSSTELVSLQHNILKLHNESESRFSELHNLHTENKDLHDKLSNMKEHFRDLLEQNEHLKLSDSLNSSLLDEKEKSLENVNQNLVEKQREYAHLEQQVALLEAELTSKSVEVNSSQDEISRLNSELSSAKNAVDHLHEQLDDLNIWESRMLIELSEAKDKICKSKAKIASLRDCLSLKDSALSSQTIEMSQLRQELQQLREVVASINAHLATYTQEVEILRKTLSAAQSAAEVCESQIKNHIVRESHLNDLLRTAQSELSQEKCHVQEKERQLNNLQEELLQKQNALENYNIQLLALQEDLSQMSCQLVEVQSSLKEREHLVSSMNKTILQKDKQIDTLFLQKEQVQQENEGFSIEMGLLRSQLQHLESTIVEAVKNLSSLLESRNIELPDLSTRDAQLLAIVDNLLAKEKEEEDARKLLQKEIEMMTGEQLDGQEEVQIIQMATNLLQNQANRLNEFSTFIQWCIATLVSGGLHVEQMEKLSTSQLTTLQEIIVQLIDQTIQKTSQHDLLLPHSHQLRHERCSKRAQSLPVIKLCESMTFLLSEQDLLESDPTDSFNLSVIQEGLKGSDPNIPEPSVNLAAFLNAWEQAFDEDDLTQTEDPLEKEVKRRIHQKIKISRTSSVSSFGIEKLYQPMESPNSFEDLAKELLNNLQDLLIFPHCSNSFHVKHLPHIRQTLKVLRKIVAHSNCDPLVNSLSKLVIHYITEKMDEAGEKVDLFHWITDSKDPLWPHLHEFFTRIQEECARFLPIEQQTEELPEIVDVAEVQKSSPLISILCRNLELAINALCALKDRIVQRQALLLQAKDEQNDQKMEENHSTGEEIPEVAEPQNTTPEEELWAEICNTTDIQDLQEFCFVMTKGNDELQRQLRESSEMNAELLKQWSQVSQQIYRVNELVDQATHSMLSIEMNLPRDVNFYQNMSKSASRKFTHFHEEDVDKMKSKQSRIHRSNPSISRPTTSTMEDSALGDISYFECEGSSSLFIPSSSRITSRRRHLSEHSYLDGHDKFQSNLKLPNGDQESVREGGNQTLSSLSSVMDSLHKYDKTGKHIPRETDSGVNTMLAIQPPSSRCDSSSTQPMAYLRLHSPRSFESPMQPELNMSNLMSAIEQHRSAVLQLRSILRDLKGETSE